ncbi:MAG TPA: Rpn family recombination-promoting nuclease/putative transposase [Candidatus Lachnoclostridium pullistercoris]|uniref:Rpn family recombination-promoting nuclease/putative transposase n=1 Tax=Candidatus Lachnoclostridium pullistercoris TaxID=2838632 RepID=A0A9D2T6K6_9FIRM|nr:Rpn family recombination-promoting nuclease/putative transposase [Candidatus Lachnoclostridium pullistercoris]
MKRWDQLTIRSSFIFSKIMRDRELCREMMEVLLNRPVKGVSYPEEEKVIDITPDGKSVRLDVYVVDEEDHIYDMEMQAQEKWDLPERSRYYQGMIDLNLLEKGENYKSLPESSVIFICTFDPFGVGRYVYTFENVCLEDSGIRLNDGTEKIFFNAAGREGEVGSRRKALLEYIGEDELSEDPLILRLDEAVRRAKNNEGWRREYMTFGMYLEEELMRGREQGLEEGRAEGLEEGRAEGRRTGAASINALNRRLLADGRTEELLRAVNDQELQARLLKEYGLR